MKYLKKDFLADVTKEIEGIKKYATEEEISKLDFNKFSPSHKDTCIYGQLTGCCTSKRAGEIMVKSCPRIFSDNVLEDNITFSSIKKHINGTNVETLWDVEVKSMFNGYRKSLLFGISVLEGYIATNGAKNKEILEYLKGERKSLKL